MKERLQKKRKSNFSRLLTISTKGRFPLFLAVLLSAVNGVFSVLPYYVSYLVASGLLGAPVSDAPVSSMVIWLLAILVIKAVTGTTSGLLAHYSAYNMLYDIRVRVVEKMAKLPLGYFTDHSAGEIRKTLVEDVEKLEKFFAHHICDFVKIIVMPITAFAVLFSINIAMSIVSLIPLLLGMIFQIWVFKSYNTMMEQYYRHTRQISSSVIEYIRGMPVVKAFNKTTQTFLRFNRILEDYRSLWMGFVKKTGLPFVGFSVCSDAGFLFALPIGIILVTNGLLSVPGLFLLLSVGVSYTLFIPMLGQVASILSINLRNLDGVYDMLDTLSLKEPDKEKEIMGQSNDIRIEQVTFGYGENMPVLINVSMNIRQGETVAFVGPSGAGKSTMANLIARFYDPQQGDIFLGGVNLRDMHYVTLMDRISYVFQENFTFSDTVLENIRMYRKDVSREQVIEVARIAQAHEFISELPKGYDTILGSRGTYLSGGQIQRLNIARAILKNSPVVILDEATAFADPENENLIQRALSVLLKDKTVIVIAHRLRTIRNVDKIYVFEKGTIVEKGKFDDLMKNDGLFHSMWEAGETSTKWKFQVRRIEECRE